MLPAIPAQVGGERLACRVISGTALPLAPFPALPAAFRHGAIVALTRQLRAAPLLFNALFDDLQARQFTRAQALRGYRRCGHGFQFTAVRRRIKWCGVAEMRNTGVVRPLIDGACHARDRQVAQQHRSGSQ